MLHGTFLSRLLDALITCVSALHGDGGDLHLLGMRQPCLLTQSGIQTHADTAWQVEATIWDTMAGLQIRHMGVSSQNYAPIFSPVCLISLLAHP